MTQPAKVSPPAVAALDARAAAAAVAQSNATHLEALTENIAARLAALAPPPQRIIRPTFFAWLFGAKTTHVTDDKAVEQIKSRVREAGERLEAAEASTPPSRLSHLFRITGATRFERDVLGLCVAFELQPSLAADCARASDGRSFPTFDLAKRLFPDHFDGAALSPAGVLRHWDLIRLDGRATGDTIMTAPLRIDERMLDFLRGVDVPDTRIASLITAVPAPQAGDLSPSQGRWVVELARRLLTQPATRLIQLRGSDADTARLFAAWISEQYRRTMYRLAPDLLPPATDEVATLARAWMRDGLLYPSALFIDLTADDSAVNALAGVFLSHVARGISPVFVAVREKHRSAAETIVVDVPAATRREQSEAWQRAIGPAHAEAAHRLAAQFNLPVRTIRNLAAGLAEHAPDTETLYRRAAARVLNLLRPKLDGLAVRVDPVITLADVVLPTYQTQQLERLVEHVQSRWTVYQDWGVAERSPRGLGISALFAGDSGTGKSMAAEAIAGALGLPMYRVDLSNVVSKYIGETEKHIARLFDAAEGGGILFFDEADALFGRRTEVRDSHDRYANIEINYLLQRMELFSGVAILASNRKQDLDGAFMRRLRFVVDFPVPGVEERLRIGKQLLPPATDAIVSPPQLPTESLDYPRLARFNLSGGHIQSIVMDAAFRAAAAGARRITMRHVLDATRDEMIKLGRTPKDSDFVVSDEAVARSTGGKVAVLPPSPDEEAA